MASNAEARANANAYSSYKNQLQHEQEIRVLEGRVMALETAAVLLARHIVSDDVAYELQQALAAVRYPPSPPPVEDKP
jgi:hypothetical protein